MDDEWWRSYGSLIAKTVHTTDTVNLYIFHGSTRNMPGVQ
jgi:cation transport regulator ChaC